ncbi:MAG TPA: hypothetical protein GXX61_05045, partial [Bacteroidales bacterium]|nr:hypothetical protein [Bacteroidales bacterium]
MSCFQVVAFLEFYFGALDLIWRAIWCAIWCAIQHLEDVLAVGVVAHGVGVGAELVGGTPAVVEGDFFRASDEQPLALLDGFHKVAGLGQGTVR